MPSNSDKGLLSRELSAESSHSDPAVFSAAIIEAEANGAVSLQDLAGDLAGDAVAQCQHRLREKLSLFGIDIVAPLALRWYNDALPLDMSGRIPVRGEAGGDTFALLVGNSKHMWEPFLAACGCHQELLDDDNPLDTYVERSVEAVLQDVLPGVSCRCYFGHQRMPDVSGGGYVALQRMARAMGLAYLDDASHLCLHPKYGAWFSLRALLVFDGVRFHGEKPAELPSPLNNTTRRYISLAVSSAMHNSCSDLSEAAAEAEAEIPPNGLSRPSIGTVRSQWQKWVAIRDAPCAGHPWRYPKHQIIYHYTADREVLRKLVAIAGSPADAPERLAVELELPEAAARRRSRERSRSGDLGRGGSGELAGALNGGPSGRWAAYTSRSSGGSAASGRNSGGFGGNADVQQSPSRRQPSGLRAVSPSADEEDREKVPKLGRDSMGSEPEVALSSVPEHRQALHA